MGVHSQSLKQMKNATVGDRHAASSTIRQRKEQQAERGLHDPQRRAAAERREEGREDGHERQAPRKKEKS